MLTYWTLFIHSALYILQLRRQARLRREYIYRKSIEDRDRTILEKKQKLKNALDGMMSIALLDVEKLFWLFWELIYLFIYLGLYKSFYWQYKCTFTLIFCRHFRLIIVNSRRDNWELVSVSNVLFCYSFIFGRWLTHRLFFLKNIFYYYVWMSKK